MQAGRPQVAWPQLQLDASAVNNAQVCIRAVQNGGLQSLSHVVIDDHPPWLPLQQQQQPPTSDVHSRLQSPLPFVPQHPQRSVSHVQSPCNTVTDLPPPSSTPTSAPSRLILPPAVPTPVLLGIPGSATPPTSLAGVPQSSRIFFFAYNIPSHLSADALKQLMNAHPGCLNHTLKLRASRKFPGANEVLVEFMSKSLADQCVSKLSGKPFLDSHAHMGSAVFKVITERELNKRPDPSPPVPIVNSSRPPPAPSRIPPPMRPTRDAFDIGDRPTAEVSACARGGLCRSRARPALHVLLIWLRAAAASHPMRSFRFL